MVKKNLVFVGLTSFMAVMALVASSMVVGCSGNDDTPGPTNDASTPDDAGHARNDAGPGKDADASEEEPDGGSVECLKDDFKGTMVFFDQEVGWKPPAAPASACTSAEFATIEKNSQTVKESYYEVVEGVSDACKACVVTKREDEHWSSLVAFNPEGTMGFANLGACPAVIRNAECGKAMAYFSACLTLACPTEECTDDAERKACRSAATNGSQCFEITQVVIDNCGDINDVVDQCKTLLDGARVLCAAGTPADGGAGDAGDAGP